MNQRNSKTNPNEMKILFNYMIKLFCVEHHWRQCIQKCLYGRLHHRDLSLCHIKKKKKMLLLYYANPTRDASRHLGNFYPFHFKLVYFVYRDNHRWIRIVEEYFCFEIFIWHKDKSLWCSHYGLHCTSSI